MKSRKNNIEKLCIAYLLIWTISPPLAIGTEYRLVALACVAGWCVFKIRGHSIVTKLEAYGLFFLILMIAVAYISGGVGGLLKPIARYFFIIAFLMYKRNSKNIEDFAGLQVLALALLALWNILTYRALLVNERVARIIVRSSEESSALLTQGIGGYALVICQTFLTPVVLSWSISSIKTHKYRSILGFLYLLSYIGVLLRASYAIPLLASAVGVLVYFIGKNRNIWGYVVLAVIIVALVFWGIAFVPSVRDAVIYLFPSNTVKNKINDLLLSIEMNELQGSFSARFVRYMAPIEAFFFRYPLIGGLWKGGAGGHSFVLDSFGQYGVFGGVVTWKILFSVPRKYRKEHMSNPENRRSTSALWISLFISMIFDSWTMSCAFVLFFVVPLLLDDISKGNAYNNW